MTTLTSQIKDIVSKLSLDEKISLLSGADFWHTVSIDRLNIPSIMMADGPHGLRKQKEDADHMGINQSYPATCFPTLATLACSWDRDLLASVGEAIANECKDQGVAIILGPGINIKRSPLGGRNFEYFSEDPYLTGQLASAMVKSIEKQGIKTCLKHFAVNNQETNRMISDSIVDDRALFEIYFSAFETVIKDAHPSSVMSAYNKLNGTYCSENSWLLKDLLREQWGFSGAVISDWGACNDVTESINAGLDLIMPKFPKAFAKELKKSIRSQKVLEDTLDERVGSILSIILTSQPYNMKANYKAHHQLARDAASSSFVLLKNDQNTLPIKQDDTWLIVGEMAKFPRYQGSGSSLINPTMLPSFLDVCNQHDVDYHYLPGYHLNQVQDYQAIDDVISIIKQYKHVVLMVGLPEEFESEGFDRSHLALPMNQHDLISRITEIRQDVIVVLSSGSAIEMPWKNNVNAILHTYLSGQGGAAALYDVLIGSVNPSGKLCESYPIQLSDTPSYKTFGLNTQTALYKESIFVGYRYYDTFNIPVLFPFGHGLSYTTFKYHNILTTGDFPNLTITFTITNVGYRDGHETSQLYIKTSNQNIYRPLRELKGFEKVHLKAKETKTIKFTTNARSFSIYDTPKQQWIIPNGTYTLQIGSSLHEIHLEKTMHISDYDEASTLYSKDSLPYYFNAETISSLSDQQFEKLIRRLLPPDMMTANDPFTLNSTLTDLSSTYIGKLMLKIAKKMAADSMPKEPISEKINLMIEKGIVESPLRSLVTFSDNKFPVSYAKLVVALANIERVLRK